MTQVKSAARGYFTHIQKRIARRIINPARGIPHGGMTMADMPQFTK